MDVDATLACEAPADAVYDVVSDLGRYPEWLDIVGAAASAPAAPGESGPAWTIDLKAQVGPFRRTKRLRMSRVVADAPEAARFERRELDGRRHSPWVLDVRIVPTDSIGASNDEASPSVTLQMHLHYGGGLWLPVLDRLLGDEIERSRPRLTALLGAP
ncbi:MAG TPA: SRPBCC family protein [Microthrixaceae bacterium]|nr:SRPBCC family protein [Microthrixaceae bacterium]